MTGQLEPRVGYSFYGAIARGHQWVVSDLRTVIRIRVGADAGDGVVRVASKRKPVATLSSFDLLAYMTAFQESLIGGR